MNKIEMVADNKEIEKIAGIISENGSSLNPRDGIIYVSEVEKGVPS